MEDSFLDSYWESQNEVEPYMGEDYNLWEEEQVYQDQDFEEQYEYEPDPEDFGDY